MARFPPTDISKLPTSPDRSDPTAGYGKVFAYLNNKSIPAKTRSHLFRKTAENDFWFFARYATSARVFLCEQEDCEYFGKHVFDHPYVFERCRALQEDPDGWLDLWPRGHLKTTIITMYLTLWNFLHRPSDTVAIITWELAEVGKGFVARLQKEMEPGLMPGTDQPSNQVMAYHWPKIFWQDPARESTRAGKVWKHGALELKSHGAGEHSISAMGLNSIRTGKHYHIIIYDDIVTDIHVTPEACQDCTAKFEKTTPLRHTSIRTRIRGVGTRWYSQDTYAHILNKGILKRRVGPEDCYYPQGHERQGQSVIHPGSHWIDDWRKGMTDAAFNANMRNRCVDEQSVFCFRPEWIRNRRYRAEPEEMAKGANLYAFIDPAKPKDTVRNKRSDYLGLVVAAIRPDAKKYIVDIRRDKLKATEWADVVFDIDKHWRGEGNPIISWWWEARGASWDLEFWKLMMEVKGHSFDMIPYDDGASKDTRIGRLMVPFDRGEYRLPAGPIHRTMDGAIVDMVEIFIQLEYLRYRPTHSSYTRVTQGARNEDVLDAMAQMESPEVKRLLQVPIDTELTVSDYEMEMSRKLTQRHRDGRPMGEPAANPWGV